MATRSRCKAAEQALTEIQQWLDIDDEEKVPASLKHQIVRKLRTKRVGQSTKIIVRLIQTWNQNAVVYQHRKRTVRPEQKYPKLDSTIISFSRTTNKSSGVRFLAAHHKVGVQRLT